MKMPSLFLAGLLAGLFCLGAAAQPAPGGGPAPRQAIPVDCGQARDRAHCEAREKARAVCGERKGAAYRQCVRDHMPPPDCSKAGNPQRCEIRQRAREACKGKFGRDHRQCLREQMKVQAGRSG